MKKYKKKVLGIALFVLIFAAGTIFFLQNHRKSAISESITNSRQTQVNSTMPVDMCGSVDEIYMIGNTFDDQSGELLVSAIYTLDQEKYKMSLYYDMTLMKSMSFEKIAMDKDDNLYSIVRKQCDGTLYEIWKIKNGIAIETYDITEFIDEKNNGRIDAFTIDKSGNFFIRQISSDEVIYIYDEDLSSSSHDYRNSSFFKDAGEVSFECMTTGKDGQVYILFRSDVDGKISFKLVSYSWDEAIIYYRGEGNILPSKEKISSMGAATDYDLVMGGNYGVYGYNNSSKKAKQILDFPSNKEVLTKSFFVEDKLYNFIIDMNDDTGHKVNAIELEMIDLS